MASDPSSDPDRIVNRLLESGQNVKLGAGVVSKTSRVALGLLGLWAVIFWRLTDNLRLDGLLVFSGFVVTSGLGWWVHTTHRFAAENPAQAMLEGAAHMGPKYGGTSE
jgi:hypothetical protein